jgi:hypothetical protein
MTSTVYNCTGLSKESVLAALYNGAKGVGNGVFRVEDGGMTEEQARQLLKLNQSFDYVKGRLLKLDFTSFPTLDVRLYNRDQGTEKAQHILASLKEKCFSQESKINQHAKFTDVEVREAIEAYFKPGKDVNLDRSITTYDKPERLVNIPSLEKFHTVRFTKEYEEFLRKSGIDYADSWHVFMERQDDYYYFTGSMGGKFKVHGQEPCIRANSREMNI